MTVDTALNIFAIITLAQLMVTIGLGAAIGDIAAVGRDWRLVARALVANYIGAPLVAIALLALLRPDPMVAVGFLLSAVFSGAPYGPPCTAMARGNVRAAVGLMVVLAASSAVVAPLLLRALVPLVLSGRSVVVQPRAMLLVLGLSQLLPLCAGLALRARRPALADRWLGLFRRTSMVLNIALIATNIVMNLPVLVELRPRAYLGMLALIVGTGAVGWLLGSGGREGRKTLAISTAVRNVGACIVIATGSFPGTAAVMAVTVYGPYQTVVVALLSLIWGRLGRGESAMTGRPAAVGGVR